VFRRIHKKRFVCNQSLVGFMIGYISVVAVVAVSLIVIQTPHGRCASGAASVYRDQCLESDALVFPAAVKGLQEIAFLLIGRIKMRFVNVPTELIGEEAAYRLGGNRGRSFGGPDVESIVNNITKVSAQHLVSLGFIGGE